MKVSVVIPCYNKASFIGGVITSLQRQTRCPDEIIVVDDASTDDSAAVVAGYAVRLVRHEKNRGLSQARNSGLEVALGEVVIFLDADAFADERLVESLLRGYVSGEVAGVGGRGIEANVQSPYDRWRALHAAQSHGDRPSDACAYLFGQNCSYRAAVLRQVGGFDTFYSGAAGEDMDVGYRLIDRGHRLYYTPDAIVYHQRTDTAESLRRSMYSWYYWAYHAKFRNNRRAWTLFAGTCRRLVLDTLVDLLCRQSRQLAGIDLAMFPVKMRALARARREIRRARGARE
jgi:glycosyltransferase involved in cell wall biosynthesis